MCIGELVSYEIDLVLMLLMLLRCGCFCEPYHVKRVIF